MSWNSDDWGAFLRGGLGAVLDYPSQSPGQPQPVGWGVPIEQVPPQYTSAQDIATGPQASGGRSALVVVGAVAALAVVLMLVRK